MDASQRRELTSGMGKSTGSYELVVSPLLLGLLGFWLDRVFGTTPLLTITFSVLGLAGVLVKLYYGYSAEMDAHQAALPQRARARSGEQGPTEKGATDG